VKRKRKRITVKTNRVGTIAPLPQHLAVKDEKATNEVKEQPKKGKEVYEAKLKELESKTAHYSEILSQSNLPEEDYKRVIREVNREPYLCFRNNFRRVRIDKELLKRNILK